LVLDRFLKKWPKIRFFFLNQKLFFKTGVLKDCCGMFKNDPPLREILTAFAGRRVLL
jgi:hypothetical protein